jgi:hypothetical protein
MGLGNQSGTSQIAGVVSGWWDKGSGTGETKVSMIGGEVTRNVSYGALDDETSR